MTRKGLGSQWAAIESLVQKTGGGKTRNLGTDEIVRPFFVNHPPEFP